MYEHEFYQVERAIAGYNGINLPNELKLDSIEPEYPKTVQDQILLDNHALQNNLTTQPELLVKQNKDLSIERRQEKLS